MAYVADHVNVYSSCIELLSIKGWEIEIEPSPYEDENSLLDFYIAIKDGTTVRADNPLALLGLASLHEHHYPHSDESYWWTIKNEKLCLLDSLEDDALERSFLKYVKEYPDKWKKLMRDAIKDSQDNPEVGAHERIGISLNTFERLKKENPDI
ncbi:MAG: hypothetical protein GY714_28815 [Desulfobacterales bacterium]|nr:hypothetical protein [Desulfobacterales bacterium]MCP4160788.1 hypothetical protein [Deltaproteobacteria bacterium]